MQPRSKPSAAAEFRATVGRMMGQLALPASGAVGIVGHRSIDDQSGRVVSASARAFAREGLHTVYFAGGFPQAPVFQDSAGGPSIPTGMRGYLTLGEAMRGHESAFETVFRESPAPLVAVGGHSTAAPEVSTGEETGVFQAVGHLIRHHGRKQIAFLAGPEDSFDSGQRLKAYLAALDSFSLPFDPRLVIRSSFDVRAGRDAAHELVQRTAKRFDGLVAASDFLALGAIHELQARGVRVPADVSVVGYGDVLEASFSSPLLTTLRPPCEYYARAIVERLFERLSGARKEVEFGWDLPSATSMPIVIRESCGCKPRPPSNAPGVSHPAVRNFVDDAVGRLMYRELAAKRRRSELFETTQRLIHAQNYFEVARELTEVLRSLRFKRLLVGLYTGNRRQMRVVFESEGTTVVYHNHPLRFPVEQALPTGFLPRSEPIFVYISPLELGGEPIGQLVLEADFVEAQESCNQIDLPRLLSVALSRITTGRELARLYDLERHAARSEAEARPGAVEGSGTYRSSTRILAAPRFSDDEKTDRGS